MTICLIFLWSRNMKCACMKSRKASCILFIPTYSRRNQYPAKSPNSKLISAIEKHMSQTIKEPFSSLIVKTELSSRMSPNILKIERTLQDSKKSTKMKLIVTMTLYLVSELVDVVVIKMKLINYLKEM